ncbi:hypothetical protein IMSAGC011_02511 [Lachnospiraceae bacterium]|nr:hypothetical protein IMSAGC011_02511 [Lachnospiraceae bacterium]
MLGKLLKYEWKGLRFPFLIMLIVLAGTTALTCGVIFTINPKFDETIVGYSVMALMLSILLYYFGIIGCSLGTMLIVVIRFYKTCYTDQGYLTHTLPVSTKQLLNTKIFAAVIANLMMVLAIGFSILIIIQMGLHHAFSFMPEFTYDEFYTMCVEGFSYAFRDFEEELGISFGLYITYLIAYFIIGLIANIVTVFGCVSLGQLFTKHRIVGAIAAYFIVQFILQILGYFTAIPMYSRMLKGTYMEDATVFGVMSPTMNLTLLTVVIVAIIMYFINLHMMTKKLNLE